MVKLKIIAFFLSLLVTLQMLPMEKIGAMLSSNQWTEELPHGTDEEISNLNVNFLQPYLPPHIVFTPQFHFGESKAIAYIHFSEQMPSNHSNEVIIPPPDPRL